MRGFVPLLTESKNMFRFNMVLILSSVDEILREAIEVEAIGHFFEVPVVLL